MHGTGVKMMEWTLNNFFKTKYEGYVLQKHGFSMHSLLQNLIQLIIRLAFASQTVDASCLKQT
jgi:hypothetical protein